ncbi:TerD family protein [Clostridium sp.]|uniref:TerD family protein n=1 Tax=Clostridium sp. TaxID=1506 RepID=UPI002626DB8A|nr:TerD family protein [Clostridium sp.]
MSGVLNLQKNDILDLTKKDPSLNKIMLAAGWDVVKKGLFSFATADYDLDLVALLLDENEKLRHNNDVIYFGNMEGNGIKLHGDNLTGAGDGDDEKISLNLSELPKYCKNIVFSVVIYDADKRNQCFGKVKNAYVRLVDEDKSNTEICRYNLSEDGGNNTAIIFAELSNINNSWQFKAKGQLLRASVSSLAKMYI